VKGLVSRRGLFAFFAILISSGSAVVALEVATRLGLIELSLLEPNIYRVGDDGALSLIPRKRVQHSTRLWSVTLSINSEGRRDREPDPDDTRPTVLGLGDSFAFGWGVEQHETLFARLGSQQSSDTGWINAAVPGTGPHDHWRRLPALISQANPRLVVLAFYVGNDFADVQLGGASRYEIVDGMLTTREPNESFARKLRKALVRQSRLLQALRAWLFSLESGTTAETASPQWDRWKREFASVHLSSPPSATRFAIRDTLDYLGQMQRYCRDRHIEFLLIVIPPSFQVRPDGYDELKRALSLTDEEIELDRPQRLLLEWARNSECPIVDLLPAFREHYARDSDQPLYHYPDSHWNANGHRLAADAVLDTLNEVQRQAVSRRLSGKDSSP
jgi:hypothetical protein